MIGGDRDYLYEDWNRRLPERYYRPGLLDCNGGNYERSPGSRHYGRVIHHHCVFDFRRRSHYLGESRKRFRYRLQSTARHLVRKCHRFGYVARRVLFGRYRIDQSPAMEGGLQV